MKYGIKCQVRKYHGKVPSPSIYFVFEDTSNYWIRDHYIRYNGLEPSCEYSLFFRDNTARESVTEFMVRLFDVYGSMKL